VGLFSGGNSKSTTDSNQRQHTASDDSTIIDAGSGDVTITDSGAIAGSVQVANNALKTAETISQEIGDQSSVALGAVKNLSESFGSALESIKKTELTGGGSLLFDNLKYWPVIPVAVVLVIWIKNMGSKSNG